MPNRIGRRRLLTLGTAASAASVMGATFSPLEAWAAEPKVPRRTLGKTGKKVPILLLGGGSGFDRNFDPRIGEALRYGVDYIDCARSYAGGRCEPHAANSLEKLKAKDTTWITSKSKDHSPTGFEAQVDESLKQLRRGFVDLYFLHQVYDAGALDNRELWKVVERLKKQGKIRHFGFSCHDGNVAELLHKAAGMSLIDVVMFRYNFRQYGNKELNAAMDAAHKANVGLIAMKTQGAEASFRDAWQKFEKTGKWNKHQAVLKAVWADPRISAAVSAMDTLESLRENIAAALDKKTLGAADRRAIERYAKATRGMACDGCSHICGSAVDAPVDIGAAMRCVMYHDVYADPAKAHRVFAELPPAARQLASVDFSAASQACPNGVDVVGHMRRAADIFG
jgi:predicted aldo/keto reductase-like oxidoreductase